MSLTTVRSQTPDPRRQQLYRYAILIALGGNALLAATKGIVAAFSGSSAVFSDAANSLSDTLYSLLMGIGLSVAQRPADESHPQGHSRFEPFVGLLIGTAMGLAGIAAISQSIQSLLGEGTRIEPGWPTVVLVGSASVKVGMYALVRRIGRQARSPAIQASARDNLADTVASGAALVGVWGSRLIHAYFDPAAGFVVGLWIFRATWEILRENLDYLTGRGASTEVGERIAQVASGVPGVDNVHRVIADYVGPRFRVDIHINVDGEMPVEQAHAIAERVEETVEAMPEVDLAFVHVEPARTQ
jgi:cation diffusion facilitator family transporter